MFRATFRAAAPGNTRQSRADQPRQPQLLASLVGQLHFHGRPKRRRLPSGQSEADDRPLDAADGPGGPVSQVLVQRLPYPLLRAALPT